ncbi:acyltransferase family protein [Aquariibacter albus]|uniref:Acyltransferase n=1 Tax=Aquariibacter albus TaxID=2759899 RepID=A0A839HSI8_9BURK|nr:acyltransferase family protein [Aquariibacter albus]MBB1162460.1 acyltransferase [Aquariibacter albus]
MHYRREIDGLRALAVVPVILFHAGFDGLKGGFVGVDVFFVISGYLITTIITRDLDAGRFSIIDFYERRARRILPALFLVLLVTAAAAWLLMLPSDLAGFAKSLVSVVIFSSNILFWQESGYFDTSAELKPLLHTWSLAVEEQFYVLFPLFLMLGGRLGKRLTFGLLVFFLIASFAFAQWATNAKPVAAFYLLPSRGWELLIGAAAAIYINWSRRPTHPQWIDGALSWLGMMLLVFANFNYSKITPFPGLYAAVPTVGAALVIVFASPRNMVGRLLGQSIFVGIGLVSYSAYLWHQPLFALARYRTATEHGSSLLLWLSLASFALAYLTWRYVEAPFRDRHRVSRPKIFLGSLVGGLFFLVIGVAAIATRGFLDHYSSYRLSDKQASLLKYSNYESTEDFVRSTRYGSCFFGTQLDSFDYFDRVNCLRLSSQQPNYLLIGDSHAAHWAGAIRNIFPNVNLLQATASGCRPLFRYDGAKRCTDMVRYIYEEFVPRHRIDGIILSGRWGADEVMALRETVDRLRPLVGEVIVFGPTAEYRKSLPHILINDPALGELWSSYASNFRVKDRGQVVRQIEAALVGSGATYIDIQAEVCDANRCRVLADEMQPMVWDYGHFTAPGAEFIIRKLKNEGQLRLGVDRIDSQVSPVELAPSAVQSLR